MSNLVKTDFLVKPKPLIHFLVYVGPHKISGEGWQMAFDFGSTQATLFCGSESRGLELTAFGDHQVQLQGLGAAAAFELLKGMSAGADVRMFKGAEVM